MLALTREVSAAIGQCELTHVARRPIDVARARAEHHAYEVALKALGCEVRRLPAADDLPDSVFVEDTAVVLPEVAILARPGAHSRRAEVASVAEVLGTLRPLASIEAPGTLDGGDVLVLGRHLFVGRSSRTNDAAISQLRALLATHGYQVTAVETSGCLHLKSAVTALRGDAVVINPAWVSVDLFARYEQIAVDPSEPGAANVVSIDGRLLCASMYPRTCERLERREFAVTRIDAGELAKAEGALTCCSILVA
jgi:dimethylargininase